MVARGTRPCKEPITDVYRLPPSVIARGARTGDGVDHVRPPPAAAVRRPLELRLRGRRGRCRDRRSAAAAGRALRAGVPGRGPRGRVEGEGTVAGRTTWPARGRGAA